MNNEKPNILYCEKCKSLTDINKCAFCGNKKVREVKENDTIYLTTKKFTFARMLEDILNKNNIPCLKLRQNTVGSFLSPIPTNACEYKFFVPFGAYEKAKTLLEEYFSDNKEANENSDLK